MCTRKNYTWNDAEYRNLMIGMLSNLEPIFYEQGTYIYKELDEFGEINFIQKGEVAIGFEINKYEILPIRYKDKCVVGGFGVTFKMRSQFLYKAQTYCQGFFIRREKWHNMLKSNDPYICHTLRQNVMIDFIWNIRSKLVFHKKAAYDRYQARSDYHNMLVVDNNNKNQTLGLVSTLFKLDNDS